MTHLALTNDLFFSNSGYSGRTFFIVRKSLAPHKNWSCLLRSGTIKWCLIMPNYVINDPTWIN